MIADAYLQAPHGWTRRTLNSCELRAEAFVLAMEKRGIALPSEITSEALDAWRKERMAQVSRATVNRDEVVAKRMLAWAGHKDRALCGATPLADRSQIKEPKRSAPPVVPSPREVALVVAALQSHAQEGAALAIATALVSGMRLDELRHLRLEHLRDGAIEVTPESTTANVAWTSKGYRQRKIQIGTDQLEIVREFVRWQTEGKGGKGKAPGLSDSWIAKRIDQGCKAAGVPSFRMHDLRRTFATENRRAGIPITALRDWLGHRDTATTERYLGRYREDAALQAATSPALAVFGKKAH